ncbi:hypothetical protein BKA62DRAFT_764685 [Auriculariales sp. MPI-PUGE-AT-0066]|nr:hypothetical protein BKA62DRAFT_764685 [Auriculariales sp. MPI-PUGE-AT-0066]
MAKGDFPPSTVPNFVVPLSDRMLERDNTYGIPIAFLASNLAWDIFAGAYVTEDSTERFAFSTLAVIDLGIIYYTVKYGPNEWNHAPVIQRNILSVFLVLLGVFVGLQYSFARYWIENKFGSERGKTYRGVTPGADLKEFTFWSAQFAQAGLSVSFLSQLLIRWDNRGHDRMTWACRTLGTVAGVYGYYTVRWYWWPEMHPYVANPFAVCLTLIGFGSDLLYGALMLIIDHSTAGKQTQHRGKKVS